VWQVSAVEASMRAGCDRYFDTVAAFADFLLHDPPPAAAASRL
jgi:hypothetical protein